VNLTACLAANILLQSIPSSQSTIKIVFTRPSGAGPDQAPRIPVYDSSGRFVAGPTAGQWSRIDSRTEQVLIWGCHDYQNQSVPPAHYQFTCPACEFLPFLLVNNCYFLAYRNLGNILAYMFTVNIVQQNKFFFLDDL
jgi:hypothetical protein